MALLPDIDCGSFMLSERLVSERIQVMTFFDNDDVAIRVVVTVNFSGVITRSDTGETFVDTVAGTDTFDVVDGALMQTAAGPADIDPSDPSALCTALA